MSRINPFVANVPLNPRIHQSILTRVNVVEDLVKNIRDRRYCLVLGPKYSGRTTILKALYRRFQESEYEFPILFHPADLDLRDEARFFSGLSGAILKRLREEPRLAPYREGLDSIAVSWDPDDFVSYLGSLLQKIDLLLVLMFDGIEHMPPHLLTRLLRKAHGIYNLRADRKNSFFKNISFNFAGSISLRLLTFEVDPTLSPFNVCTDFVLRDLAVSEARRYLEHVNELEGLELRDDAVGAIVDFAGGDLNMIQRLSSLALAESLASGRQVDLETVKSVVDGMLATNAEESLRYMAMQVEEDVDSLDLVLRLLDEGSLRYEASDTYKVLYNEFKITSPELTGALILEQDEGLPARWLFRNKITSEFLRNHFTPRRLVKTFTSLGLFDEALDYCAPLLAEVREEFDRDILAFDDAVLKDVVIAMTNRIYAEGSHEFAYRFFALLLNKAFGCPKATYYDYVAPHGKLRAVKFLAGFFDNDGTEYDVNAAQNEQILEVSVCRTGLFAIQLDRHDELRIAIPLENIAGDVTGIITLFSKSLAANWAQLSLRVQVIQRTLRSINIALSKVELDNKSRIMDSVQVLQSKGEPVKVFVAHRFNRELLTNLREHLGRASQAFRFEYADELASGFLLSKIQEEMEEAKLCLYEVSVPNCNVYLELGLGLGMNIPGLMFLRVSNGTERQEGRVPPLLRGIRYLSYSSYSSLIEELNKRIEETLNRSMKYGADSRMIHFLGEEIWERQKRHKYAIILDHNHFGDQQDYRAKVEPVLQAIGLEAIYPLEDGVDVARLLSGDHFNQYFLLDVYSLIQHADLVVARAEEVEGSPQSTEAFIPLGIALALNDRNLVLTRLGEDFQGKSLRVPEDLAGKKFLEYTKLSELGQKLQARLKPIKKPR